MKWGLLLFLSFSKALAAVQPGPAPAPAEPSLLFSLFRVLGALAIVLALFFAVLWLLKHWQTFARGSAPAARLKVLEARALAPRQTLYVVGYEQQRLLIASSPGGISMLARLPEAAVETETPPPNLEGGFARILRRTVSLQN